MAGLTKQRIVAAADGVVRFIVDQFETRQGASARPCYNNYIWIEHSNGEWTKYSHMEKGSSRGSANLKVGDALRAGAYLGMRGTSDVLRRTISTSRWQSREIQQIPSSQ